MKKRECPNCDYQYSRLEYIKTFFLTIWTHVECKKCEQKFTIDLSRRIIVASIFGFWGIILNTAITYFDMSLRLWFFMIPIFLFVSFYIFTFDAFKKIDGKK
jgi:CXXC-20-CXXC protein